MANDKIRNNWSFHPNNLQKMGKKNSPNDSSFFSNLKNAKQILSWKSKFNKYLQRYLLARSNVPHFSTKKESGIILKMTNFWRKNVAIFHEVKKKKFVFLTTSLFLMFVNKEIFLKEYIEMELKIFFIISEGCSEWQK